MFIFHLSCKSIPLSLPSLCHKCDFLSLARQRDGANGLLPLQEHLALNEHIARNICAGAPPACYKTQPGGSTMIEKEFRKTIRLGFLVLESRVAMWDRSQEMPQTLGERGFNSPRHSSPLPTSCPSKQGRGLALLLWLPWVLYYKGQQNSSELILSLVIWNVIAIRGIGFPMWAFLHKAHSSLLP